MTPQILSKIFLLVFEFKIFLDLNNSSYLNGEFPFLSVSYHLQTSIDKPNPLH